MKSRGLSLLVEPRRVEARLWRRLHLEGDGRAREELFARFAPLARALAKSAYRSRPPYGLELGDFHQLAFAALLQALDAYDPLRGTWFEAFARPRIKGAIADGAVRSSEAGAQYAYRRRIERERLRSLGVAEFAGQDVDHIASLATLAVTLAIGFMAQAAAEGASKDAGDPYESLAWRQLQARLQHQIATLPEAERTVIQQHYINDVAFAEIATLMNLSKGRISQLHKSGLLRIKQRLKSDE